MTNKLSPVIYRYDRYKDSWGRDSNLGGITYAIQIDYKLGVISAGVAICETGDNFDKKFGREVALKRLMESPIRVAVQDQYAIVENLKVECFKGCVDVPDSVRSVYKRFIELAWQDPFSVDPDDLPF